MSHFTKIPKIIFERWFKDRSFLFFIPLGLFVIFNWLLMTGSDKLACNDFYPYYFAQVKLFSGNIQLEFITPLFPLLLGLSGRLISLLSLNTDTYILGGQIVSLFSGFGVLFFSFRLLDKLAGKMAYFFTLVLAISPFFLKVLSTAQTDMLYLFFVTAFFYTLSLETSKLSIPYLLGGALTRFEGVLLLGSYFIHYITAQKKYWKALLISSVPLGVVLVFIFNAFAVRMIDKVFLIFDNKLFLFYFQHPGELGHLLYGNLLYFLSPQLPGLYKWSLFWCLMVFFLVGMYRLLKNKLPLALALIFYQIIFLLSKGYTRNLNPEREFRRWLSFIWIFYVVAVVGLYFLLKKVKQYSWGPGAVIAVVLVSMIIIFVFLPFAKSKALWAALLLLVPLIYSIRLFRPGRYVFVSLLLVMAVFLSGVYADSLRRTQYYLNSDSNAGSYMISNWLNGQPVEDEILVYSHWYMMNYYTHEGKMRGLIYFPEKEIYENRERLLKEFMKEAKRRKVKYIAFDDYWFADKGDAVNSVNKLLHEERDKNTYFRVKKHLFYKGRWVAAIMTPIFD